MPALASLGHPGIKSECFGILLELLATLLFTPAKTPFPALILALHEISSALARAWRPPVSRLLLYYRLPGKMTEKAGESRGFLEN